MKTKQPSIKPENRLKQSEIKGYRDARIAEDNICPLCRKEIQRSEAALDHDHRSGRIRRPLHLWCNRVLGSIENWSRRGSWDNVDFLENIVSYLKSEHTDIIHPNHGKSRRKRAAVSSRNKKRSLRKPKETRRRVQTRRIPVRKSKIL
jgi:Recombination endonuclease VII